MSDPSAAIMTLQHHLAHAEDAQLREIVALVDSLPRRGPTDAIIAPLRGRLLRLRPARRLHVGRLIFVPADRVIVPATSWRRGMVAVPRHALTCLTLLVRQAMGQDYATLANQVDGTMSDDSEAILRHGRTLWPRAAAILAHAQMPPEWPSMTGLGLADFTAIARPLAILLGEAVTIEELLQRGSAEDFAARAIRQSLNRALAAIAALPEAGDAALSKACLGLLLCVCLDRLPDSEIALIAAGDLARSSDSTTPRLAADAAIDAALDQAEENFNHPNAAPALADVQRLAALLDTLEQPGPAGRPSRKPRVMALRRALTAHCRSRFTFELSSHLLPGLFQLDQTPQADALLAMEAAARTLRTLAAMERQASGMTQLEQQVADCAKSLPTLAPQARRVDLARLVEILQGSEAALAMLDLPDNTSHAPMCAQEVATSHRACALQP